MQDCILLQFIQRIHKSRLKQSRQGGPKIRTEGFLLIVLQRNGIGVSEGTSFMKLIVRVSVGLCVQTTQNPRDWAEEREKDQWCFNERRKGERESARTNDIDRVCVREGDGLGAHRQFKVMAIIVRPEKDSSTPKQTNTLICKIYLILLL